MIEINITTTVLILTMIIASGFMIGVLSTLLYVFAKGLD